MQFNKFLKVLLIGSVILGLSACSHTRKGAQNAGDYDANNAQASGLGNESGYRDGAGRMASDSTYYFDFDRSVVREKYKPSIYAKADYLVQHPNAKVILEGHTDPRGSREYNVGLGERRANAVASIMKARGVNPNQIRVVSYGAERRAQAGYNEESFQMDRRSVTVEMQG